MVIDDSEVIRQVVSETLKSAGYNTILAEDGVDALSKLKGVKVHLMICDVNMPNMDGLTFIKEVKKQDEHKFTPIIMLTTETKEELKAEGRAAGARAWMVKPFQPDQMLSAVAKLIMS